MTCAVINPRADAPRVMKQLYDALKAASCRCVWAWGKGGYAPVKQCSVCAAIDAYEEFTEASNAHTT